MDSTPPAASSYELLREAFLEGFRASKRHRFFERAWSGSQTRVIVAGQLGATGQHPEGHAGADDEGELKMAVACDHPNGIVRLVFGTPTTWLGLPAQQAIMLANALLEKAHELERRKS